MSLSIADASARLRATPTRPKKEATPGGLITRAHIAYLEVAYRAITRSTRLPDVLIGLVAGYMLMSQQELMTTVIMRMMPLDIDDGQGLLKIHLSREVPWWDEPLAYDQMVIVANSRMVSKVPKERITYTQLRMIFSEVNGIENLIKQAGNIPGSHDQAISSIAGEFRLQFHAAAKQYIEK